MSEAPGSGIILKINGALLRASLGLGLGCWLWRLTAPVDFALRFVAVVLMIGGTRQLTIGLWHLVRHLWAQRRMARYRRQGGTPKADRMASEDDLRAKGLLK